MSSASFMVHTSLGHKFGTTGDSSIVQQLQWNTYILLLQYVLTNLEGENVVIPELVAIAWNLCEAEASDTAGSCLGSVNPDQEKRDKIPK